MTVGTRVAIHPACDCWMRGDRYGEVVAADDFGFLVRLDKSGEEVWFAPELVSPAVK